MMIAKLDRVPDRSDKWTAGNIRIIELWLDACDQWRVDTQAEGNWKRMSTRSLGAEVRKGRV